MRATIFSANVVVILLVLLLTTVNAHNAPADVSMNKADQMLARLKRSDQLDIESPESSSAPNSEQWPEDQMTSSLELLEASSSVDKREDNSRLMDRFLGMRGKKESSSDKRAAVANGFFGMRGKKYSGVSDDVKRWPGDMFYGMRGRKRGAADDNKPVGSFFGMRGKKDAVAGEEESFADIKRGDAGNRFFGMRGKKSGWSTTPPYVMRIAGDAGNDGNFRLLLSQPSAADNSNAPSTRLREKLFYRNLQMQKPSFLDRKRQVGNIFIGMRG